MTLVVRMLAFTALGALLGGCSDKAAIGDDEIMAQARTLTNPAAGLYEETTRILSAEVPGAPPAQADRLRDELSGLKPNTARRCITAEQAGAGFDRVLREMGEGINGMACRFTRFEASAPRMKAFLSCSGPNDAAAGLAMAGTTSAEGFDVTMDLDAQGAGIAGGAMKMRMQVMSRRIGDCPVPGSAEPPPSD